MLCQYNNTDNINTLVEVSEFKIVFKPELVRTSFDLGYFHCTVIEVTSKIPSNNTVSRDDVTGEKVT